jgi:pyridoxal phosphate-dependent aminotransferase EpsN
LLPKKFGFDRTRHLATQARENQSHYEHREVGFNYRLSNICAAIGLGQLRVLDQRVARRRAIFARYRHNLERASGVAFMPEAPFGRPTRWLTVITVDPQTTGTTAENLRLALERANIESRPVWKPMHMQPVFASSRMIGGAVSERLFANGICLPSGSSMSDGDVDRVSEIVLTVIRSH